MKVLVDTSVWSRVLRRSSGNDVDLQRRLADVIVAHRAQIIGPIRQELLSGIKDAKQFDALSTHLSAFPDHPVVSDDFVTAAKFFNICRSHGVQGSNTDFLICAVSVRGKMSIFTKDDDFSLFARHLPITLYE